VAFVSRIARGIGCAVALASTIALAQPSDVLTQLGIPAEMAKEAVGIVLNNGIFNPGLPARAFKLMSPEMRGTAAAAGIAWLRTYTSSEEFKQTYAKLRDRRRPATPAFDGTPEDELRKQADEQKQQAEESKKAIANLPPEQRAQLEEALAQAQALAAQQDTPEMRKARLEAIKTSRAERAKDYEQQLAIWKDEYPENPSVGIAKRLREFLQTCGDVDFAAKTTMKNGKMVFDREEYQSKSSQWKMCYRAGPEATGAALTAVRVWLKDLGG